MTKSTFAAERRRVNKTEVAKSGLVIGHVRQWVAALRSGEYAQVQGHLKAPITFEFEDKTVEKIGHCCLGVACELVPFGSWHKPDNKKYRNFLFTLPPNSDDFTVHPADTVHLTDEGNIQMAGAMPITVAAWYGFNVDDPDLVHPKTGEVECASAWNDNDTTFAQIADMIEFTYLFDDWKQTVVARAVNGATDQAG